VDHLRRQALVLTLEEDKPMQLLAVHEASKPRASRVPREREACGRTAHATRGNVFPANVFSEIDPPPPPPHPTPGVILFGNQTVPWYFPN
jgi:hypothetical protein